MIWYVFWVKLTEYISRVTHLPRQGNEGSMVMGSWDMHYWRKWWEINTTKSCALGHMMAMAKHTTQIGSTWVERWIVYQESVILSSINLHLDIQKKVVKLHFRWKSRILVPVFNSPAVRPGISNISWILIGCSPQQSAITKWWQNTFQYW
jgi:hypothetical protein